MARCEKRAAALGAGGVEVVNLFAWRSTDPKVLKKLIKPVGDDNDAAIRTAAESAGRVVVAWGKDGTLYGRDQRVLSILRDIGADVWCLGQNSNGTPKHPLYLGDHVELRRLAASRATPSRAEE